MPDIAVPDRSPDGEFMDLTVWKAETAARIDVRTTLCADAVGRICRKATDITRAHDEGAFPIRFWLNAIPQRPLPGAGAG